MIKSTVEKMAEPIGFEIGASDDVTQANLLNAFCKGLYNSMNESHNRNLQICYIVYKLDPKACEVLKSISEFIKTKEEEK